MRWTSNSFLVCGRSAFHIGPDRDVGHEVSVHDVHMDPVGAGRVDGAHLLAELGEVGGEDGRGDGERAMHRDLRPSA